MMVKPFSNTKLRIPKGFQSLLVSLSTEILRNQPRNIHAFAAEYFEKLLQRREQGQSYVSDKQTTLEDRYYNNQSFQNEYSVNNSDVNTAATKIQAQFRGYKARRDFEKIKQESKQSIDFSDKQESDYDYSHDEYQKSSFDKQNFEELMEEERREKERAAIAIQAQFRGFQVRKHLRESLGDIYEHPQQQEFDHNYDKISSTHFNDHHDLDKIEGGKNDDINRPHLERDSTELSDDFERHTQIPRDSNFAREQKPEFFNEDDMSDSTLDKAATRIQASYRGYKTRKELGSVGNHSNIGHDQHHSSSMSSQIHDEYNNTRNKNILSPSVEGNKVPANESAAAAVKIQAAYRGYRVRKDLEK